MKRLAIISSLILICLTATAFGQTVCEFNIVGTWKATSPNGVSSVIYRFEPNGMVTMLSPTDSSQDSKSKETPRKIEMASLASLSGSSQGSKLKEIARGTYTLDDAKSPKSISFTITREGEGEAKGATTMKIVRYDDRSFTSEIGSSDSLQWVRMDSNQYFLVLAGRSGVFYDSSGPTFPILIKTDGRETQVDAVGIYFVGGKPLFGAVPAELRDEFMKESRNASDVMLRLEISAPQYERGLKVLRTWDRRAREGALLYPEISMDNILLVKQVTETLNQCGATIKLYNLDWGIYDHISENNPPSLAPFFYFKELRRLNESLHVADVRFQESMHPAEGSARQ
jgi:hypothetical protein